MKNKINYENGRGAWDKGLNKETRKCKNCDKKFECPGYSKKQFCSKSCSNRISKRKQINMDYLLQLKNEGKTNKECSKLIGINGNIIGKYVNQLIEKGELQKPKKIPWNKGNRTKEIEVICQYCNKHFKIWEAKYNQSKNKIFYCDKKCESNGKRKHYLISLVCKYCKKDFKSNNNHQKYCSIECRNNAFDPKILLSAQENYDSKKRSEVLKAKWDKNKNQILEKRNTKEYKTKIGETTRKRFLNDIDFKIKHSKSCREGQLNISQEQRKAIVKKAHQTKKENGSYKKSIQEDIIYNILKEHYPDSVRQYTQDIRYPFACDFYIPCLDLFIEYQGHWTHGNEPYNGKNISEKWIEKFEESDFYKLAVNVYVDLDPQKRRYVIDNNLNFLEIWELYNEEYLLKQVKRAKGLFAISSKKFLIKELSKIKQANGNLLYNSQYNKIVLHYQPHFYEEENKLWRNPIIQKKIIMNRMQYLNKEEYDLTDQEILRGFKISGIHYGFSHFNPLILKYFIQKYNIQSIYDPCAGWGHRLLGSDDYIYFGNDIDKRTTNGLNQIINDFNLKNKFITNFNAIEFVPKNNYDAVFTCPPYYNLEKYNNSFLDKFVSYEDWLKGFWLKVVRNSLINCKKYFAFVINEKYRDDFKGICQLFNLRLVEESVLEQQSRIHFSKNNNKKECLIVYSLI